MIHKDPATGAEALNRTYAVAPYSLPQLIVTFSVGIALLHRELIMYLWRNE